MWSFWSGETPNDQFWVLILIYGFHVSHRAVPLCSSIKKNILTYFLLIFPGKSTSLGYIIQILIFEHIELLQGYNFVDRDGKHFRHILNWLRDGAVPTLTESKFLELLREAEYYQLLVRHGFFEFINIHFFFLFEKNHHFIWKDLCQLHALDYLLYYFKFSGSDLWLFWFILVCSWWTSVLMLYFILFFLPFISMTLLFSFFLFF